MNPEIAHRKQQLRANLKSQRRALSPAQRQAASQKICHHLSKWPRFQRAGTILSYLPMQGEVDLRPLFDQFPNKKWAVPRILPQGKMAFHTYKPHKLVLHPYGMQEPTPTCPVIPPTAIELTLAPGLAFDRQGWRLGYGGGFYDRFLENYTGELVGICFEALRVTELPRGAFDIPVPFLATEEQIYKTPS